MRKTATIAAGYRQVNAGMAGCEKSISIVLASLRSSTGTRPPHHSAARTDVVSLFVHRAPLRVRLWSSFAAALLGGGTHGLFKLGTLESTAATRLPPVLGQDEEVARDAGDCLEDAFVGHVSA